MDVIEDEKMIIRFYCKRNISVVPAEGGPYVARRIFILHVLYRYQAMVVMEGGIGTLRAEGKMEELEGD